MSISVAVIGGKTEIREILVNWLEGPDGFGAVESYGNAEEGLRPLRAAKPSVVLVDVNLPRVSGIEFVRQLKPLLPETQFVMLAVYEDMDVLFDSLAAGASGFFALREPRSTLLASIRDLHEGRFSVSSSVAGRILRFFRTFEAPHTSDHLTAGEQELLAVLQRGYLMSEIPCSMGISLDKGFGLIRSIFAKLHRCSASLAPWVRNGWRRDLAERSVAAWPGAARLARR